MHSTTHRAYRELLIADSAMTAAIDEFGSGLDDDDDDDEEDALQLATQVKIKCCGSLSA